MLFTCVSGPFRLIPVDSTMAAVVVTNDSAAATTSTPTTPSSNTDTVSSTTAATEPTVEVKNRPRGPPVVEVLPNPCTTGRPECRIIIYNVAKKQNVGNIVRSAVGMYAY
jgi:tRNA G18 (ribose-2'-O)-methylase SpoU